MNKSIKTTKSPMCFIILLILVGCNTDEFDRTKVEKEVLQSFDSLVVASKSLDADKYFRHFDAENFIGLNSDGFTWHSLDELKILIESGFRAIKKVESLQFKRVKLSIIDNNTVVLVNEFEQSMVLKDGSNVTVAGGGTQLWSKNSGAWKLVSISASNKSSPNRQ